MAIVGLDEYQVAGTRPANQAPISLSCSGPEGGGLATRRLPRWAPLPVSLFVILRDYTITWLVQAAGHGQVRRILNPTWEGTNPSRS